MSENLLIGNGFNLAAGIDSLSNDCITERFIDVLMRTEIIYNTIFNTYISRDICRDYIIKNETNIEKIADNLFEYIKSKNKQDDSLNLKKDIIDLVKISALNALFYNKNHFLNMHPKVSEIFNILNQYSNIFSLNYLDVWDINHKCIYLHGEFINNIVEEKSCDKPILLYDEILYKSFNKYQTAINELKEKNILYPITNPRIIIFSPSFLRKQEAVNMGIYSGENLYPSDHLFPAEPIMLYAELNYLTSIDVFGVSPYGDDDLIEKLRIINNGTIYVHDTEKKENDQLKEWEKRLGGNNFSFKNTSEFGREN